MKRISTFIFAVLILCIALMNACNDNSGTLVRSKEDSLKLQVDRGNYLVNSIFHCTMCHSQLNFKKFSMPVIPGTEGGGGIAIHEIDSTFPGKIFIPNITSHALKDWTDKEIARAMTKGINRDGDTMLPMMPYHEYSQMAKEDVDAVIAYLRTMKSIETNYPKRQVFIPASFFGGDSLPDNDYTSNIKPDTADKIKYGAYLVKLAGCKSCHTPDPDKPFSGGAEDKFPGFTVRSSNITPDSATGIGSWTEEMFIAKFRNNSNSENVNREAGKYNTIMPWSLFGSISENDLKSIYAYLRSLPPVHNTVVKWPE